MRLYDYFRSSAAYRVRIALNIKGVVPGERRFVHLRMGNQRAQDYLALNPQGLVPALALDDGRMLTQSLAIIEYLDETHPEPPLLPADPAARARVRAIALQIACEIHPLDNLRVLNYLTGTLGVSKEQKDAWYRHWIDVGFEALEKQLAREPETGRHCHGDAPTLADVCLVPQLANARRFAIDLSAYPTLTRIEAACNLLPAFAEAAPSRQPDAE
ncbi:MAG: maleylacetoacetate isomerase [Betaproteobacteria bacterium]|nr:maleylacetoacetate isomerase [Betaproteobacteria bacterium]MDE2002281.1 maleylacetoacetate isomerase [Betaproteobacteria bacterium]MDE2209816.1 maleylacetoacetate isomerase [Betaproteobacteria bacterium]MDE2360940.1 maleylacetoacetate isomerase [Betaproteobacteria bacterium]